MREGGKGRGGKEREGKGGRERREGKGGRERKGREGGKGREGKEGGREGEGEGGRRRRKGREGNEYYHTIHQMTSHKPDDSLVRTQQRDMTSHITREKA